MTKICEWVNSQNPNPYVCIIVDVGILYMRALKTRRLCLCEGEPLRKAVAILTTHPPPRGVGEAYGQYQFLLEKLQSIPAQQIELVEALGAFTVAAFMIAYMRDNNILQSGDVYQVVADTFPVEQVRKIIREKWEEVKTLPPDFAAYSDSNEDTKTR